LAKSEGYVNAAYLKNVAQLAADIKHRSYQLMAIERGDSLLDVGCGPGVDLPALVERVGAQGKVYALDVDSEMLTEAKSVTVQHPQVLEFREADVAQLPFTDRAFNAVRAERLFQVLPEHYSQIHVASEMARVLKPKGRLVMVDTDWASASVDFSNPQLERRLLNFFTTHLRPNGFAGRQLASIAERVGLQVTALEVTPLVSNTLDDSPFAEWLPSEAMKAGVCSEHEAQVWRSELSERVRQRRYYACVNIVSVCAIKR